MSSLLIIPYLGNVNDSVRLALSSLLSNSKVEVLFISENEQKFELDRLKTIILTREKLSKLIKDKIEVDVSLEKYYKLCDLKPLYFKIFEDYINETEYEYIGFCDTDVIYGNVDSYIKNVDSDVIGRNGHFMLFNRKAREYILDVIKLSTTKFVLESNKCYAFDEFKFLHVYISKLVASNDLSWEDKLSIECVDLDYYSQSLYCQNRRTEIQEILFDEVGIRVRVNDELAYVPYVHFQKREMPIDEYKSGLVISHYGGFFERLAFRIGAFYRRLISKFYVESIFRKYYYAKVFESEINE
ncbi:DUF6625 family protein [Vibrio fortis]|uniref:DUF6625 family protein n=1 Tax=Vibrio fortis TaxID=212667 RepID=UPI0038CD4610